MADGLEQPRIWWRRMARRRRLCLGVTLATCALGWNGVCLLAANQPAVAAGAWLSGVLLAGIASAASPLWPSAGIRCSTASRSCAACSAGRPSAAWLT